AGARAPLPAPAFRRRRLWLERPDEAVAVAQAPADRAVPDEAELIESVPLETVPLETLPTETVPIEAEPDEAWVTSLLDLKFV
ncbi:MAG: hypothetical protein HOV87_20055, partial [Catenulispora sp.]|nr:hypothetical protein [Catenulispora sp.]